MAHTIYNDVVTVISNEAKIAFAKQNSGYKFAVIGALLFVDSNEWVKHQYQRMLSSDDKKYLQRISYKDLKKNTQLILTNVNYDLVEDVFIPKDPNYQAKMDNPIEGIIPVNQSFYNDEFDNLDYISYDAVFKAKSLPINTIQNSDGSFDGIIYFAVPYKLDEEDYPNPMVDTNNLFLFCLTYFPTQKIKYLHNQNKKLAFNMEVHFKVNLENGEVKDYIFEEPYANELENSLHLVNDGTTNTVLPGVNTFGGTTKLLLW